MTALDDDQGLAPVLQLRPDGPPPVLANIPPEFWPARPMLARIRDVAHDRLISADALLGVCLARVAALMPPALHLPPVVAAPSPLSICTALYGDSGAGKSGPVAAARTLLPIPTPADDTDQGRGPHGTVEAPLGSGEGLVELFMGPPAEGGKDRRQVRAGALVLVDEGSFLTDVSARAGSTILPILRQLWAGGLAGQANATAERRRILQPMSYSIGLVIAMQTPIARHLLTPEAVAVGTPQRFLLFNATDPSIPDTAPPTPAGPLGWEPPQLPRGPRLDSTFSIAEPIRAEIRRAHLARSRREVVVDTIDNHRSLYRLRVAALLAALDDRLDVDEEDWHLAGLVVGTSDALRAHALATIRWEVERAEAAADNRARRRAKASATGTAEAAETAEERILREVAAIVVHAVGKHGPQTRREINSTRLNPRVRRKLSVIRCSIDDLLGWAVENRLVIGPDPAGRYALPPAAER